MLTTSIKWILTFGIFISVVFLSFPEIDIWVSGLFYTETSGFFLRSHPFLVFLHKFVPVFTTSIAVILLTSMMFKFFSPIWLEFIKKKQIIFLILALAIGPGLVVNAVFKDNWGRARPVNTEIFGGHKTFTPPLIMSDQGGKSFSSGDPSVGFFLIAFALLCSGRRRRYIYLSALGIGFVLGAMRVMMGAHFFSDVLFSCVFVLLTTHLLHMLMFGKSLDKTSKQSDS